MKLERNWEHEVRVTLSLRNLLTLASKVLREGESARTLEKTEVYPEDPPTTLVVIGELDASHYQHRPPGEVAEQDEPQLEWGVGVEVFTDLDEAKKAAKHWNQPLFVRIVTPWNSAAE